MSDQICSHCIHAALDSSGVYCKLFNEQIFDEKVAQECGEFEADTWPAPAAEQRPVLVALPSRPEPERERERTLACHIEVEYFGRSEHGEKILKNLEREMACLYGEKAKVKRA